MKEENRMRNPFKLPSPIPDPPNRLLSDIKRLKEQCAGVATGFVVSLPGDAASVVVPGITKVEMYAMHFAAAALSSGREIHQLKVEDYVDLAIDLDNKLREVLPDANSPEV